MGHASALAILLTAILVGIGIVYTRLVIPPKAVAR
jgi:archaellum component FlaF (FlaF/FlaG flagellin family)